MVDLNNDAAAVRDFIDASIRRFQSEREHPRSVGIYGSAWGGWISINFNVTRLSSDNCPDLEFIEFDLLEFPDWREEFAADVPQFRVGKTIITHHSDSDDEDFNETIFDFLEPIVHAVKQKYEFDFLLQMLDSRFVKRYKREA